MVNIAAIFSTLGNPNSLVPLIVKDTFSSAGMTVGSFVTGKEEGQDRFIDEVGTEILWLGGIPAFKWLFDKTVFKAFNLDSAVNDYRVLKNKDVFEKIKEYAPTEEVKKNLEKIGKKQKLFQNLSLYKFLFSTAAAIVTYIGLTRAKHAYTEKQIKKNLIKEHTKSQAEQSENDQNENNSSNPSFKGLGNFVKDFALSPVKNQWLMDGAITTERLYDSRSPQEFTGYAIREGLYLFFMYYMGNKIQSVLEKRANDKNNKSIALDARVLESEKFQKSFTDGSLKNSLDKFSKAIKLKDAELYEFLHKNPENDVVKVAKQSDLIKMYKEPQKWYEIFKKPTYTDKIDTRKYIDLEEIKGTYKKLETLHKQYQEALAKGESSEQFFKSVKKLKRNSIISNIGISIFALGMIVPGVMLEKRLAKKNDKEFHTKKQIREQLINEGIIS